MVNVPHVPIKIALFTKALRVGTSKNCTLQRSQVLMEVVSMISISRFDVVVNIR
jgi:hypothetical protein